MSTVLSGCGSRWVSGPKRGHPQCRWLAEADQAVASMSRAGSRGLGAQYGISARTNCIAESGTRRRCSVRHVHHAHDDSLRLPCIGGHQARRGPHPASPATGVGSRRYRAIRLTVPVWVERGDGRSTEGCTPLSADERSFLLKNPCSSVVYIESLLFRAVSEMPQPGSQGGCRRA